MYNSECNHISEVLIPDLFLYIYLSTFASFVFSYLPLSPLISCMHVLSEPCILLWTLYIFSCKLLIFKFFFFLPTSMHPFYYLRPVFFHYHHYLFWTLNSLYILSTYRQSYQCIYSYIVDMKICE